jgi:hypothetical protein
LLDAQNNFMSIYTNYEALRRALDFDLGTLQLTSEGLWVDPEQIGKDYGQASPWDLDQCEDGIFAPADEADFPAAEELPPPKSHDVEATALFLTERERAAAAFPAKSGEAEGASKTR